MEFNSYSTGPIISLISIFSIGTLAYRHNPSSSINRSFFYFCLSLCFWLLVFSLMYNSKNESLALLWIRIGFLGNPFIAISAYFFIHQLLSIDPIPHFKKLLLFWFCSITLFNSPLIYAGIKKDFWGFYLMAGKLYFVYTIFFAVMFLECIRLLFIAMRKADNSKTSHYYRQIKYVFFAFILGSTGIIDFIAKYPTHIYPFGWLSALLFIVMICYAILRYQIQENEFLRQEVAQTEKFKSMATLASSLAHEIKNPLTALATFTEYLPQRKSDPDFLKQYEQLTSREIKRINALVQDLLDFAKPSTPQMRPIDPNELITHILDLIKQQCMSAKISVRTHLDGHALIQADPNQLKQALLNLILNAIDAMANGGVLTIKTIPPPLAPPSRGGEISKVNSLPLRRMAREGCIIEISDTGCGIAPQDLLHIFEPFYTKKEKGTGLGLAITQGIIEKHGGRIEVKSTVGKGTEFKIYLGQMRI